MNEAKELREAIAAADYALDSLCRARDSLNSARNWGIFDIVGGGLISTLIKRSKMNDASAEMEAAKRALERFRSELNDVDELIDIRFNENDLMAFADYFFDGFLADLVAQSRINDARVSVDRTIAEIQRIRRQLQTKL